LRFGTLKILQYHLRILGASRHLCGNVNNWQSGHVELGSLE
jgi:hypothetical protein